VQPEGEVQQKALRRSGLQRAKPFERESSKETSKGH
jgi:hypothetical protein